MEQRRAGEGSCLDTIVAGDFTEVFVKAVNTSFTADEQTELLAFLWTAAGKRYASFPDSDRKDQP